VLLLVYFFSAVRAGARTEALSLAALTGTLALVAVLLASAETDSLFDPKNRKVIVKSQSFAQRAGVLTSPPAKLIAIVIALGLILLLIALFH
jgi:hypothetical protein